MWASWAAAGAVATGWAAGCTAEEPASTCSFPATTGTTTYVAANGCGGSGSADGSKANPYATIEAATKGAKAGTTIAVAAGTYKESVALPAGVNLTGSGATSTKIQPPTSFGISVTGTGTSAIGGLTVNGAKGVGIVATGAGLELKVK